MSGGIKPISWRYYLVILLAVIIVVALVWRAFDLMVCERGFLREQGNQRILRTVSIAAFRGMIKDRNGHPLAISIPVDSVWINPQDFVMHSDQNKKFARILHINLNKLLRKIRRYKAKNRTFMYIKRGLSPDVIAKIKALNLQGLYFKREYKRYYPTGEVSAHVVGFTNIDDKGQEGLELSYDDWLRGKPGKMKIIKDGLGRVVANLEVEKEQESGSDLVLSIDQRIQYLAYSELKNAIKEFQAKSGSIVVLNVKTGEVLAMVNQPSFNPNNRVRYVRAQYRNRAVTDVFEPGSTIKAFSIASALDSGLYNEDTLIDTNPGWLRVGHNVVRDEVNRGVLNVSEVLQKSSNVGVTKMVLSLPGEQLWGLLHRVGFGEPTQSGFPGERDGELKHRTKWKEFELATLAFGYSLAVTPLQLAHAYAVVANNGIKLPVSLVKREQAPPGERVMDKKIAQKVLHMLETVTAKGGTGTRARIAGYRVAGKTGTARLLGARGYEKDRYLASFVGTAPVGDPALVVAVVIKDPQGAYYGAVVAAPVFARVMAGALRILDIPMDKVPNV